MTRIITIMYDLNSLLTLVGEVLPLCREAVGVFYSPSRLGHPINEMTLIYIIHDAVTYFKTVFVKDFERIENFTKHYFIKCNSSEEILHTAQISWTVASDLI